MNSGFAALGSDGMSIVIWGIGDSEDLARADAQRWLSESGSENDPMEIVPISAQLRQRSEDTGTVDAVALGLLTRDEARGVAHRLSRS